MIHSSSKKEVDEMFNMYYGNNDVELSKAVLKVLLSSSDSSEKNAMN